MKGFTNSTKMQMGHNFPSPTSVMVPAHQRAMPAKAAPAMQTPLAVTPPSSMPSATGLSPTGYPPRPARITMKETGKLGVRKPRTSQVEPSDGDENGFAKGGRIDAAKRKGLPKSEFGLPGSRKYPMPDRSHAANAKARATQMANAGKLSESSKAKIDSRANRVLNKAKGGMVRDPHTPLIRGC